MEEQCFKEKLEFKNNWHQQIKHEKMLQLQDIVGERILKKKSDNHTSHFRSIWKENSAHVVETELEMEISHTPEFNRYTKERFHRCKVERQICRDEGMQCAFFSHLLKFCRGIEFDCFQRQKSSQKMLDVLHELSGGSAFTFTIGAHFKATHHSLERKIVAGFTFAHVSKNKSFEENQATIHIQLEAPTYSVPFLIELKAHEKINRPSSIWNTVKILSNDLTKKFQFYWNYGFEGEEKEVILINGAAYQTNTQHSLAKKLVESRKCNISHQVDIDELSSHCEAARNQAAMVDAIFVRLSLPLEITPMATTKHFLQCLKSYFFYQLTEHVVQSSRKDSPQEEYEIEARLFNTNNSAEINIYGQTKEITVKEIVLGPISKILLPMCTRENINTRLLKGLTNNYLPSSCIIGKNYIKTFDNVKYAYQIGDCEHVVLADCTVASQLIVLARISPEEQELTVIAGFLKYNLHFTTVNSTTSTASVKINDKETTILEFPSVNDLNQEISPHKKLPKSVLYHIGPYIWQTISKLSKQVLSDYANGEAHITFYEDNVFEISSREFGITIRFNGKQIEITSQSPFLMNKLCGLCGDFNAERTNDVQNAGESFNIDPRLSALSYMLNDNKCTLFDSASQAGPLPLNLEKKTIEVDITNFDSDKVECCHKDSLLDVIERQLNITNILI